MSDQTMTQDGSAEPASNVNLAFGILATVQATLIFTIALIMIPLPEIAIEFALSESRLLLLQVAYGLPFSGLLLFGGRLTDRYGAQRMFIVGVALFGTASLVAALAPGFEALVTMRFLQGVGGAIIAPAALGLVRSLFPDIAAFGRAMAVWGGVSVLGAILGFISSGMIASFVSWRWMFVVPIAVSLLGLATGVRLLGTSHPHAKANRPGLDLLGALLATAGIVLASYGLIASHETSWASPRVSGALVAGTFLLVLFLFAERKVRDPLLPPAFLLNPVRILGLGGMLLAAAGSLLLEFVLLVYLQKVRGWTSFETAASFLPFAMTLIGTNFLTASIVGKLGAKAAGVAGFLIGAAGLAWLAFLDEQTAYLVVLLPAQILLAIGMALIFSAAAVMSTDQVDPEQMGLAGGVMNTAMELGPTVGFAVLMAVAATRANAVEGYAWAFATAAAVYGAAAGLALVAASNRVKVPG